jgi:hypothetical protein
MGRDGPRRQPGEQRVGSRDEGGVGRDRRGPCFRLDPDGSEDSVELLRTLLLSAASGCYFLGPVLIPLPTASALTFSGPILVAALGVPLLGERVDPRRWGRGRHDRGGT